MTLGFVTPFLSSGSSSRGPHYQRDVRVRGEARFPHAYPQVRVVCAEAATTELPEEQPDDRSGEGGVLGRTASHAVDLTVEILMLDVARGLEREVVRPAVVDAMRGRGLGRPKHDTARGGGLELAAFQR